MSEPRFCVVCGARLSEGARFCNRCGKPADELSYSVFEDETSYEEMGEITIGRTEDNQIVVNRPYISARHATLKRVDEGYQVIDHKTLSGTYVNGEPIWGRGLAKAGDTIGVGSFDFKVKSDLSLLQRDLEGKLFLEGWNLTYRVRKPGRDAVKILDDSSIVVHPSELVAILGPSGHGKTTLLNALIRNLQINKRVRCEGQWLPALEGETWINTEPLGPNYHAYMRVIGFVPQDDLVHPDLTVRESLRYTHRLRLPADHSEEEVEQRIEQVLDALKLDRKIWDQRIGSPEKRGLSGGERKRVNIAIELLTDPDILVLDEPTSGLASTDALNVVQILHEIAGRGKTVIFTVHQPSTRIMKLIDRLAIVAKSTAVDIKKERETGGSEHRAGGVVYYGPAWGERGEDQSLPECAARYFLEDRMRAEGFHESDSKWDEVLQDADSVLEGLDTQPIAFWRAKYGYEFLSDEEKQEAEGIGVEEGWGTSIFRRYVLDRSIHSEEKAKTAPMARLRRPPGLFHQWWTLTSRFAKNKWKSAFSLFILLAQAPVIGITLIWVYHDTFSDAVNNMVHIPLFLLVTVAIWFGCSNAAREIVAERVIFHRERMLGQSIAAYVMSKSVVLLGLSLFQCFIMLGLVHTFIGLHGDFLMMLMIMVLSAMGGVGMGFLLSALVPTPEAANAFVPLLLIPQLVFGGLMQPLGKMDPLPTLVAYATPTRWGYEAMMVLEETVRNDQKCPRQNCDGTFALDNLCGGVQKKLEECVDQVGGILDGADGMLIDEDQEEEKGKEEGKEEEEGKDNTGPPRGHCMPTQFTRECEFVVQPTMDKEYRQGMASWVYMNILGGSDRRSTDPEATFPDAPLGVLLFFMLLFHFGMFFVLRARDVGVERSGLLRL